MLTILFPHFMPLIRQVPGGLLPLDVPGEARPFLVVKVPKEYILAAKLNASFKIYATPLVVKGRNTCGLVTAFFDDSDEPLILRSPLMADYVTAALLGILRKGQIDVHFFDEHSRELLVYRATVTIPDTTQQRLAQSTWLEPSAAHARGLLEGMMSHFQRRTEQDDLDAIVVSLDESVYGDGLFIQDLRPENHGYQGSRGFSHTVLEREEPGSYQEEDIIQCLQMVFPAAGIHQAPKRVYDNEEICDILVITDSRVLIVQAKDSPNIERISKQKLSRKRANVMAALKKALEQVKGAVGYLRRNHETLELIMGGARQSFDLRHREIKALIVVKELFDDQYREYSRLVLQLVDDKRVDCIALDYPELYKYCANLEDESRFFEAYDQVMGFARQRGEYPRLRFGLAGD